MTNELKAKIFAQHIGCNYRVNVPIEDHHTYIGILNFNVLEQNFKREFSSGLTLELKSLSDITEEDELMLCDIIGTMDCTNFLKGATSKVGYALNLKKSIEAIDFLRSKGYALPYLDYSIKDLVKEEIYKLVK